jgi:hypothetical protein
MTITTIQNGNTLLFSGFFPPCRAATTGSNIVLSGLQTVDGVALIAGDRVLVKDQTDQTTNGIYTPSTGNWIRTTDANNNSQFFDGMCVVIAQGSFNTGQIWVCTCLDDPVVVGTSLLTFASITSIANALQSATSTSSVTIGTGSKSFTIPAGKHFSVGQWLLIYETSNPTNAMLAQITGYSGGALTVSSIATGGSGTLSDWSMVLTNSPPAAGLQPPVGTGNVTGPGSSVAGHVATFTDATGKVLADGGGNLGWQRLAQTTTYAGATTDDGSIIALGGGAFYAYSLAAASGFPSQYRVLVVNEDSGRAKCISLNGLTSFYLWPLQSILIFNDNGTWQVLGRSRWILPTSVTFNVDHGSGSDLVTASDGLGGGAAAFATIQNAWNVLQNDVDCNGNIPTIQNKSAETFTESVTLRGGMLGAIEVFLQSASQSLWQCGAASHCLDCRDGAVIEITGFKLASTGSGSIGVACSQLAVVDFASIEFGTFTNGYHQQIFDLGSMNYVGGTYVVSGNMISHWFMQGAGHYNGPQGGTISVPNALTFTSFLQIIGPAYFQTAAAFSGTGAGAGSLGKQYALSLNGVANTTSSTLPGATSGTTATGAQYT